ncbi:MAG: hypothetical protein H6R13_559 [Proteobacteria bacterium]|nr:hypothetical protein [Pseudomonadota bacterium]
MTITASIVLFRNEFIASLSDGRRIEQSDLRQMADGLHRAGILPNDVQFEWSGSAGQRMITAGQQVALRAELRRLARNKVNGLAIAA